MDEDFPEIKKISDQVDRYSPRHAHFWQEAIRDWSSVRKRSFCLAVRSLQSSHLMSGRVAKIIARYNDGPLKNTPILVFGEIPPGGGGFKEGTNQLIFSLDGAVYWRNPFSRGLFQEVEIQECDNESRETEGDTTTEP